jgi:beta-aspartyl-peptidase (threonine type)
VSKFSIALHGGAGNINKANFSQEAESAYNRSMEIALEIGVKILADGGSSLNAVEAVIVELENCPLFNAGKGSVYNALGKHEMDAAIMCGKTLNAGAVAGVAQIKNPITLARAVMEKSNHVMLIGKGAENFAVQNQIEIADEDYFFDEKRFQQWKLLQGKSATQLDHASLNNKKFGTVGAVALDVHGNLAAATSTGGMTNKMQGRVGDSPIIGAGTYANNKTCAISCTGHGEHYIKNVVAYDISCLIEHKGLSLQEASDFVVMNKLKSVGAEGGLIAVDASGNIAMPYNTNHMFCMSYKA